MKACLALKLVTYLVQIHVLEISSLTSKF